MAVGPKVRCVRCGAHGPRGVECPCRVKDRQRRAALAERAGNEVYSTQGHKRFSTAVKEREPYCTCGGCPSCSRPGRPPCTRQTKHADHYPRTRDELVALGLNPDDPRYGRGLCWQCHSRHTATDPRTKGGWNRDRGRTPY